jgi:hypothetical protein
VVEGARLESVYTATYRGFESLSLRHCSTHGTIMNIFRDVSMNMKLIIPGILISFLVFADGYYPELTSQDQPWSITASIGNGKYQHIPSPEGDAALARLALSNELLLTGDVALGLELGVQNGNHLHFRIPYQNAPVLRIIPVHTYLSPMLDLLVTAKSDPLAGSAFYAQIKGGIAYRNWRIQQNTINELSQLAGEIQAGFGYPITALASLNLLYQGVFGGNPDLTLNLATQTAQLSNIPILHALLLGLSVNL